MPSGALKMFGREDHDFCMDVPLEMTFQCPVSWQILIEFIRYSLDSCTTESKNKPYWMQMLFLHVGPHLLQKQSFKIDTALPSSLFFRWGNWGSEKVSDLSKVTQLVSDRIGLNSRAPALNHHVTCFPFLCASTQVLTILEYSSGLWLSPLPPAKPLSS